jgi:ABC-type transporter Mla subunit MlaD
MKKFFTLIFSVALILSCTDYDSQFDQLDNQVEELNAANDALEAQLADMAALNASVSEQTAAKLAEFQGAVGAIVDALGSLGEASAATIAQVSAIIQAISDLATQVATNAATAEQIAAAIAEIQAMLDLINENVLHHAGGGSSDDSSSEEATTTSYAPVYSGTFSGTTVVDDVYTFPAAADSWAGFANENADIYPLSFVDGGTITFTASAASDAGVKFRFEKNPYPDVDPAFETDVVTVSGASATEYSVTIPARPASETYSSALLYLTTRDVGVTITDISITVPN